MWPAHLYHSCMQITVCAMRRTNAGLFVRHSTYLEIAVERGASYQSLVEKAASATKLQLPAAGDVGETVVLKLFKMNGAIICSDDIQGTGGFKRPWSLGNYLQLLLKKSPSRVKIGVGMVTEKEPQSDSSDLSEVSIKCACMFIHNLNWFLLAYSLI